MKAVQYRVIGRGPEVVEIPTPEPGPGQIRLKVTAAGLCHSDWFVMDLPEGQYTYGLPLTLGHEGAGVVDKLGDGVEGIELHAPSTVPAPRAVHRLVVDIVWIWPRRYSNHARTDHLAELQHEFGEGQFERILKCAKTRSLIGRCGV